VARITQFRECRFFPLSCHTTTPFTTQPHPSIAKRPTLLHLRKLPALILIPPLDSSDLCSALCSHVCPDPWRGLAGASVKRAASSLRATPPADRHQDERQCDQPAVAVVTMAARAAAVSPMCSDAKPRPASIAMPAASPQTSQAAVASRSALAAHAGGTGIESCRSRCGQGGVTIGGRLEERSK
jgi:hypothetical protein